MGGAAGAQTLPSYFASPACGSGAQLLDPPNVHDTRDNAAVGAFIIDVEGHAP